MQHEWTNTINKPGYYFVRLNEKDKRPVVRKIYLTVEDNRPFFHGVGGRRCFLNDSAQFSGYLVPFGHALDSLVKKAKTLSYKQSNNEATDEFVNELVDFILMNFEEKK